MKNHCFVEMLQLLLLLLLLLLLPDEISLTIVLPGVPSH